MSSTRINAPFNLSTNPRKQVGENILQMLEKKGFTPFTDAENEKILKMMSCADLTVVDKHHDGVIHLAAWYGQTHLIEPFIQHGADIDQKNKQEWTPLMRAINVNQIESAKELIRLGADINASSTCKWTPWKVAQDKERTEIIHILIDKKSKEIKDHLKKGTATEIKRPQKARFKK